MERNEIMEYVADYFGIENDGNIDSYTWNAGCSIESSKDKWLTLAEVVECIENLIDDYFLE